MVCFRYINVITILKGINTDDDDDDDNNNNNVEGGILQENDISFEHTVKHEE